MTDENEANQASVMGLVIRRLYLGKRPSPADLARNGSILKRLNRKYDWETLTRVVEGLALRRDRGKLMPAIGPKDPVDLRWVWSKDQALNQVSVCEDEYYMDEPRKAG